MTDSFDILSAIVLDSNTEGVREGQIVSVAGEIAIAATDSGNALPTCSECCFRSGSACRAYALVGFTCYDATSEWVSFREIGND